MNRTITDQIDQTENPTCSAKMDQIRLRRAIFAPPLFQASTSSAFQSSIVCWRVISGMEPPYESVVAAALPAMTGLLQVAHIVPSAL